jgi:hypothetical protein
MRKIWPVKIRAASVPYRSNASGAPSYRPAGGRLVENYTRLNREASDQVFSVQGVFTAF